MDAVGRAAVLPADGSPRRCVEIECDRQRIAATVFDATVGEQPELVSAVGSAAALALDNERLQAQLRGRINDLETSRRRVLDASLKERQRIERECTTAPSDDW